MKTEKIESALLGDCYYKFRHPAGLDVYVYPKTGFESSYAIFGTNYGSIDKCFQRSDETKPEAVPEGIAHYLEHKLFESADEDAFARFSRTGANANAFTSFDVTAYLFSCTDKFYESLEILLDFVQSPYFTEETVAKEQGIIGQEIRMYDDDPEWRVMFNFLRAMYHVHPIRDDIAGTIESIAKITPDYLFRCYNTFYNLNNMALCVCGNVDPEKVRKVCDKGLKPSKTVEVKKVLGEEPADVLKNYIEQKLSVSIPLFQFGYKEAVSDSLRSEKEVAATEILLDVIASDSSSLFKRLMDRGLINESSFSYEYFEGKGYSTVIFSGESKDPQAVADEISGEIERLKSAGISKEDFERSARSLYGSNVCALNSSASIASSMLSLAMKSRELFTYIEAFTELTKEDIEKRLFSLFDDSRKVLSVINPL